MHCSNANYWICWSPGRCRNRRRCWYRYLCFGPPAWRIRCFRSGSCSHGRGRLGCRAVAGAINETKFSADVVPVRRTVRSTPPPDTLWVRITSVLLAAAWRAACCRCQNAAAPTAAAIRTSPTIHLRLPPDGDRSGRVDSGGRTGDCGAGTVAWALLIGGCIVILRVSLSGYHRQTHVPNNKVKTTRLRKRLSPLHRKRPGSAGARRIIQAESSVYPNRPLAP